MRENPQREFRARCQYGGINLMVADREQLFQSTSPHSYTSSYTSKPLDLLILNFLYTWYYTQEGMGMQVMLVDNVSLTETVWYPLRIVGPNKMEEAKTAIAHLPPYLGISASVSNGIQTIADSSFVCWTLFDPSWSLLAEL